MFGTVMRICSFAVDAFKWTMRGASNNVKPLMLGLAVGTALWFGVGDLFAQETNAVSYQEIVSFDNIFDTIRTSIGGVVAGALGLGLAIWGARYVFYVIKSMGR